MSHFIGLLNQDRNKKCGWFFEGMEKVEQIEFIEGLEKAPVVQGYYYSKPLRAEEVERWLLKQYGTVV